MFLGVKDRICLVTGANTGVGLETARALSALGATVVMTARDPEKGRAAVEDVKRSTGNDQVELLALDLASLQSVRDAASRFAQRHHALHVLVNNAGLILTERTVTEDGFEATFGINHLGHFELTQRLLPLLESSAPARIINLSSEAHRSSQGLDFDDLLYAKRPYRGMRVYADSKLANLYFTRELARRVRNKGIVAHAVHPGVVRTGFGMDGDARGLLRVAVGVLRPFMLTPAGGAQTSVHVATSTEAESQTGLYWERSRPKTPTAVAKDDEAARRLWAISERLIREASAQAAA